MGVLACDRKGCTNVLSDFYSNTHGYLCYSCKTELIALGPTDIYTFMGKCEYTALYSPSLWEGIVDEEFSDRYGD